MLILVQGFYALPKNKKLPEGSYETLYYPRHSLRFIPDTYFTVFGIGGTTLCRGMKVGRGLLKV